MGDAGLIGDAGVMGDTGVIGDAGAMGDAGVKGDAGVIGDADVMGDAGVDTINRPGISIVIAAHNVAAYLAECLDGIVGQSYRDFEVIVVDDGSDDGTGEIISRYEQFDGRISSIRQERKGAGVARNAGMDRAKGEYLLFFDGDDVMLPGMLEALYNRAIANGGADVVACRASGFEDGDPSRDTVRYSPAMHDGEMRSGSSFGDKLFASFVGWAWDKLFRAEFIREHGLKFQDLSSTNDAYFVFSALALAHSIAFDPGCYIRHRIRSGSIEAAGGKTVDNAYQAYRALRDRLQAESVRPETVRSCDNWALNHFRWAIARYAESAPAQCAAVDNYCKVMAQCREWPDGYYVYDIDREIRHANEDIFNLPSEQAFNSQLRRSALLDQARLEALVQLEACKVELQGCRDQLFAVEHSLSYRIGRAITSIPRAIRGVFRKR